MAKVADSFEPNKGEPGLLFAPPDQYRTNLSGLLEVALAKHVADKTNWQALIKGDSEPLDLRGERDRLLALCASEINGIMQQFPGQVHYLPDASVETFRYPVLQYPAKVTSFNLEKSPDVIGTLTGIKGQYLLLDTGVINIRKYTAYQVELLTV